jgi:hypothetical protein
LVFVKHQPELRHGFTDLRHDAGQQIRPDRRDEPDLELACERIGIAAGQRDDFIAFVQHAPRSHHDLLADLGELHVLRLAFHQFDAQVLFQFLQLRRQSRLAYERALGRLAEMTGVGQRHQISEILEIYSHRYSLSKQSL